MNVTFVKPLDILEILSLGFASILPLDRRSHSSEFGVTQTYICSEDCFSILKEALHSSVGYNHFAEFRSRTEKLQMISGLANCPCTEYLRLWQKKKVGITMNSVNPVYKDEKNSGSLSGSLHSRHFVHCRSNYGISRRPTWRLNWIF